MAWNGSSNVGGATPAPKKPVKKPSALRGVAAGFVVVAVAVVCIVLVVGKEGDVAIEKSEKQRMRIKEVAPAIVAPVQPVTKTEPSRPILGKTPSGDDYVAMTAKTNDDGIVTERYQLADGTWRRVVLLQRNETLTFDNDFDLALSYIATTPLNQDLPPLPDMGDLDKAFKEAIKAPIVITDKDDAQTREKKEAVKALRLEIADLLAQGYSVKQIFAEQNTLRQKNIELRRGLQAELNKIWASGDKDGAQDYFDRMNKALDAHGVVPLVMPGSLDSPKHKN